MSVYIQTEVVYNVYVIPPNLLVWPCLLFFCNQQPTLFSFHQFSFIDQRWSRSCNFIRNFSNFLTTSWPWNVIIPIIYRFELRPISHIPNEKYSGKYFTIFFKIIYSNLLIIILNEPRGNSVEISKVFEIWKKNHKRFSLLQSFLSNILWRY